MTMNELSCQIIKDLLPSYVDGICSDESKQAVEAHMEGCEDCRALKEALERDETQKSGPKELDYIKKVKKNVQYRGLICIGIIALLFLASFMAYGKDMGLLPGRLTCISAPLLILGIYFMFGGGPQIPVKRSKAMTAVSAAVMLLAIAMMLLSLTWFRHGFAPFNIPANRSGPFISMVLLIMGVVQLSALARTLYVRVKTGYLDPLLLCQSITGSQLALAFMTLLRGMDSVKGFMAAIGIISALLILEGAACLLIIRAMEKRKREQ